MLLLSLVKPRIRIPPHVQAHYPEVPWRNIINMRNRLIHGYDTVMLHLAWGVVQTNLPPLKAQVAAMTGNRRWSLSVLTHGSAWKHKRGCGPRP